MVIIQGSIIVAVFVYIMIWSKDIHIYIYMEQRCTCLTKTKTMKCIVQNTNNVQVSCQVTIKENHINVFIAVHCYIWHTMKVMFMLYKCTVRPAISSHQISWWSQHISNSPYHTTWHLLRHCSPCRHYHIMCSKPTETNNFLLSHDNKLF